MTRLEQQWPELARELAAFDSDQQRQIATRAARACLDAVGSQAPDGDENAVKAEVERLDMIAWDIQGDEAATPGDYELAFRRARAVDAYALARFGGTPADAVYEALHALGAPEAATFLFDH